MVKAEGMVDIISGIELENIERNTEPVIEDVDENYEVLMEDVDSLGFDKNKNENLENLEQVDTNIVVLVVDIIIFFSIVNNVKEDVVVMATKIKIRENKVFEVKEASIKEDDKL